MIENHLQNSGILAGIALFLTCTLQAAPPANDAFASRQVLSSTPTVSVSGTTLDATQEALEPIYRSEGNSVWYQWTAPSTGLFKSAITVADPDAIAPLIGILKGSTLDALELLAPDGANSEAIWNATSGQVYFFHVASGENSPDGPFTLSVSTTTAPSTPANDNFASAIAITGALPKSVTGTTVEAGLEAREPREDAYDELNSHRSVWYTWTPSASAWTQISTLSFDEIHVYTGASLSALVEVAKDVSGVLRFSAVASTPYRIQVLGSRFDPPAPFTLTLSTLTAAAPANDNFASKTNLASANPVTRSDSNVNARVETSEKLPASVRSTVWYTWTAPTTNAFAIEISSPDLNYQSALYTGTTLSNALLQAASEQSYDEATGNFVSLLVFKGVASQSYQIQVGCYGWESGSYSFKLRTASADDVSDHLLLTSFTTTPSTVAVNASGGSVSLEAKLSSSAPGYGGQLEVLSIAPWRHSGYGGHIGRETYFSGFGGFYFPADSTTTGNLVESRFTQTLNLAPTFPSGTYAPQFLGFGSNTGQAPIPGGGNFTVTNSGAADALPSLTTVTVSPSTVNVTTASVPISISAQATDDHGVYAVSVAAHGKSGIAAGFINPEDGGAVDLDLTTPDATNGTWTASAVVPKYARPGTYALSASAVDIYQSSSFSTARFGRDYGFFNPFGLALPAGSTQAITVVNTGTVDIMPPQWISSSFDPPTVDVRAGPQNVMLRVRLRDALSGISFASGQLYMDGDSAASGAYFSIVDLHAPPEYQIYDGHLVSGDVHDGVWEVKVRISSSMSSGTAQLFASLKDENGNSFDLNDASPGPFGTVNFPLVVVGDGPANPAESAWGSVELPGFQYSTDASLNADLDHDGIPNIIEFHLGTSPTDATNSSALSAVPASSRAGNVLRLDFQQSATNHAMGSGSVTKLVGQSSPDLIHWTEIAPVAMGGDNFRVQATAASGRVYLRLAAVPIP